MDLAIYINELLGLKGEVNVPGIGFFAQKRVSGYYSDHEGKFYPPRHEIVFDPQTKDNDGLAAYISEKKNISPASAKYFIEKYATGLKQEASVKSAAITGLGHLFYEYSTLSFKTDSDAQGKDPAFYGFTPVAAQKIDAKPEARPEPALQNEPVAAELVPIEETPKAKDEPVQQEWTPIFDPPAAYNEQPEEVAEGEEEPRGGRPWVIILLIVMIGLLCFGVAYQFKPEWFGKRRPVDTTIIVKGPPPAAKQPDTTKPAQKDTTAKSPEVQPVAKTAPTQQAVNNAPQGLVIDSTKSHWEVFLSAFKTKTRANEEIEKYKAAGIPAFISPDAKGKLLIKIIAGSYDTEADAEKAKNDLIKTGKVPKNIYSLEIKPKKIK